MPGCNSFAAFPGKHINNTSLQGDLPPGDLYPLITLWLPPPGAYQFRYLLVLTLTWIVFVVVLVSRIFRFAVSILVMVIAIVLVAVRHDFRVVSYHFLYLTPTVSLRLQCQQLRG